MRPSFYAESTLTAHNERVLADLDAFTEPDDYDRSADYYDAPSVWWRGVSVSAPESPSPLPEGGAIAGNTGPAPFAGGPRVTDAPRDHTETTPTEERHDG